MHRINYYLQKLKSPKKKHKIIIKSPTVTQLPLMASLLCRNQLKEEGEIENQRQSRDCHACKGRERNPLKQNDNQITRSNADLTTKLSFDLAAMIQLTHVGN